MNIEQLKQLWERAYGQTPDDEIIELMGQYIMQSEENEKTLLWLLMKSSTQVFKAESARALWIALQVRAVQDGGKLPALNDPMRAA